MAAALEASGRYRVLRQVEPCAAVEPPPGTPIRTGLLIDLETTALDPAADEILEWTMLPFTCGLDGTLYAIGDGVQPATPALPADPARRSIA
ncbi:hypothetical protein [Teichococcus oryzae]|uniref:3'-5' exonuclease n=1 Tax=Teichococcus oryzae TaxID=1608942 RepID=A0A5B2TBD6_9PROT|nr:hypothetical protein [Pseudoroseomonas oryzae]KAA2211365.1 hypothetical protein F0Q34_20490 [Pseudoroseomonas oryzae]